MTYQLIDTSGAVVEGDELKQRLARLKVADRRANWRDQGHKVSAPQRAPYGRVKPNRGTYRQQSIPPFPLLDITNVVGTWWARVPRVFKDSVLALAVLAIGTALYITVGASF